MGVSVGDLKTMAQESLNQRFLKLAGPDGRLLDLMETLEFSGLEDGDCIVAVVQQPQLAATDCAFALWCEGLGLVTWGHPDFGGDSAAVQDQLKNIRQIRSTRYAFAAILADGSVVTWGTPDFGGDSTVVQDKLQKVQQIHSTERSFAAIWGK